MSRQQRHVVDVANAQLISAERGITTRAQVLIVAQSMSALSHCTVKPLEQNRLKPVFRQPDDAARNPLRRHFRRIRPGPLTPP